MSDKKLCVGCGNPFEANQFHRKSSGRLQSKCPQCRSNDYYLEKYKEICNECRRPGKVDLDKICAKCNKKKGLKQCLNCKYTLSQSFCFSPKQSRCKKCVGKRRYKTCCLECNGFYKIYRNGLCINCNRNLGIKECRKCKELLFLSVYFEKGHAICRNCKLEPIRLGF